MQQQRDRIGGRTDRRSIHTRAMSLTPSDEAAADGDAVGDGELADLDAVIRGEANIEVPDGGREPLVQVRHQGPQ